MRCAAPATPYRGVSGFQAKRGAGGMDPELAGLWEPGIAAVATLLATDLFHSGKARLRRLLGRAAAPEGADPDLPGELEEAREDAAAARALGDSAAARDTAAALARTLRTALDEALRERPAAGPELHALLADAVRLAADAQQSQQSQHARPAAGPTAPARPAAPPQPAVMQWPARLPRIALRPARHYQNHEELLRRMDAVVADCAATGRQAYLYLTGIPGIGKNATACQWLTRHRHDLTGPQLDASLARDAWGNTPAATGILERWLRRLGVPAADVPAEPADRLDLLADTLAGSRAVFLLTDVVNPAQVRGLVPALDDSVVLLTSQALLPGLRSAFDAEPLAVDPLGDEHSRRLLYAVARLADEGLDGDQDRAAAVKQLTGCCDGHPLALVAVGAQLAVGPPGRIHELAQALSRPETRMRALSMDEEISLSAALDPGYRGLDAHSAHVYRCLGLHPTPDFETDVLRAMLPELDLTARHDTLRRLAEANFVEPVSGTRYRFRHGLVHAHALERAQHDEPAAVREAVRGRIADFYLELLERAEAALSDRFRYDPAGAYAGYAPTGPVDEAAVVAGLERRHDALCQAVRLAHGTGRHAHAWRMAQALHTYFLKSCLHTDWIAVHEYGVASARECNDLLALARMHFETGFAHQDRCSSDLGDPRAARDHLAEALRLVAAEGRAATEAERRTRSSATEALALLAAKTGEPAAALRLLADAESALEGVEHPRGLALLALHRSTSLTRLGEFARAEAEALDARRRFAALPAPDRYNQAKALTRCAEARHAAGRSAEALAALDEALTVLAGTGTPYQTAAIHLLRGTLHHTRGATPAALPDWSAAHTLFTQAGSPRAREAQSLLTTYGPRT